MSKAILLSIKPKWVADILNGEKTIEIRKTMPKCDLPIDVYIYCTKGNKKDWHLIEVTDTDTGWEGYEYDYYIGSKGYLHWCLESKVVAKFTLRKVEQIRSDSSCHIIDRYYTDSVKAEDLYKKSCLTKKEFEMYENTMIWFDVMTGAYCNMYAWHIEDLVIFDEPRELIEFGYFDKNGTTYHILTKAPQNFCYIESEEQI